MKKHLIYSLATLAILTTACNKKIDASSEIDSSKVKQAEQRDAEAGKFPIIKFTEEEHDFGTINEGDKAEHLYTFKNEGTAELFIIDAKPSCGCTIPEFTKSPVAPGATGEIKVIFDSTGKPGEQAKSITVVTNTKQGEYQLKFKAQVKPKNK